jgi:hypothetical protein
MAKICQRFVQLKTSNVKTLTIIIIGSKRGYKKNHTKKQQPPPKNLSGVDKILIINWQGDALSAFMQ